jgi:siroheme synthase-like protein
MSVLIELRPEAGPVLMVGGGAVALRRVRNLCAGGFSITVIAPSIVEEIHGLPGVDCAGRAFEEADIAGEEARWALVFACTGDREVNRRIGEAARSRAIPVVVADSQEESTFFTPATLRDGGLQVAVSTGGADPALAKQIRERIAAALGPGWANVVEVARRARQARLGRAGDPADE